MSDNNVLIEGRVSTNILSFSDCEYLYTGTVCHSWKENCTSVYTDLATAFESPSRIQEASENNISCQCPDYDDSEKRKSCDFLMEYAEIVDADVSVFKKIHEMGNEWGDYTMQNAAIGNKIDIVKFMHEHGCPLNRSVLYNAVNANSLELVEYLAEHKCPIDDTPIETDDPRMSGFNKRSMEQAIAENYLDIVKCLRAKMDFPFASNTFRVACEAKHMDIVAYLHAEGCTPDGHLFHDSIKSNNYHVVKFMLEKALYEDKCPSAMKLAVTTFRGNIMELLMDHGFEVNDEIVDLATYDMWIVKWFLRERACKITPGAYINTVEYDLHEDNCLEVLEWLHNFWKLDIGFKSFDELMQNQRWSIALEQLDPSITEWFENNLA